MKEIDYQVQIRIIEARQLSGMQLDPICTVTVGSQKKHTAVKEQTKTQFWDEVRNDMEKIEKIIFHDFIQHFQEKVSLHVSTFTKHEKKLDFENQSK